MDDVTYRAPPVQQLLLLLLKMCCLVESLFRADQAEPCGVWRKATTLRFGSSPKTKKTLTNAVFDGASSYLVLTALGVPQERLSQKKEFQLFFCLGNRGDAVLLSRTKKTAKKNKKNGWFAKMSGDSTFSP